MRWEWYVLQAGFWLGVVWIRDKFLRKDVTGIGGKTRELERKRLQHLAVQLEIWAAHPDEVRRLARHLHDTV